MSDPVHEHQRHEVMNEADARQLVHGLALRFGWHLTIIDKRQFERLLPENEGLTSPERVLREREWERVRATPTWELLDEFLGEEMLLRDGVMSTILREAGLEATLSEEYETLNAQWRAWRLHTRTLIEDLQSLRADAHPVLHALATGFLDSIVLLPTVREEQVAWTVHQPAYAAIVTAMRDSPYKVQRTTGLERCELAMKMVTAIEPPDYTKLPSDSMAERDLFLARLRGTKAHLEQIPGAYRQLDVAAVESHAACVVTMAGRHAAPEVWTRIAEKVMGQWEQFVTRTQTAM
jgi:hypothetical protein